MDPDLVMDRPISTTTYLSSLPGVEPVRLKRHINLPEGTPLQTYGSLRQTSAAYRSSNSQTVVESSRISWRRSIDLEVTVTCCSSTKTDKASNSYSNPFIHWSPRARSDQVDSGCSEQYGKQSVTRSSSSGHALAQGRFDLRGPCPLKTRKPATFRTQAGKRVRFPCS